MIHERGLKLNCENSTSIIDTVGCGAKNAAETVGNAVTTGAQAVGNTVSSGVQSAGQAIGVIAKPPSPAPSSADSITYAFAAVLAVIALLFQ